MDRKVLERKAEFYSRQEGRKFPRSNQIVTCGVITHDRDKALSVMDKKGAVVISQSRYRIEWKVPCSVAERNGHNNERWVWRNWSESCRGHRFYKVIVDENIDDDIFRYIIAPHLANYCCSFEII